jgi:hypothetical protein
MATNTNPDALSTRAGPGWLSAWPLDLTMDQFLSGMALGSICCAKPAGIKAAAANNTTPYQSAEPGLNRVERRHSEFIVGSLFPQTSNTLILMNNHSLIVRVEARTHPVYFDTSYEFCTTSSQPHAIFAGTEQYD